MFTIVKALRRKVRGAQMIKTKLLIILPLIGLILSGCTFVIPSSSSDDSSSESSESSSSSSSSLDGLTYNTQVTTQNVDGIIPTSYSSDATYFNRDGVYYYGENILRNLIDGYPSNKDAFIVRSSENLSYRKTGWIANLNSLNTIKSFQFTGGNVDCLPTIYLGNSFGNYTVEVNLSSTSYFVTTGDYGFFKIVGNDYQETFFDSFKISWTSLPSQNINNPRTIIDVSDASKTKVEQSISISSSSFTNSTYWMNLGYASDYTTALNLTSNKSLSGDDRLTDYLPNSATNNPQNAAGIYYRVSTMNYGDNGNSFRINTLDGSEGPVIYKNAAYTNIEDVAAYIVAFGDVPPNARYTKGSTTSAINNWGPIARVNYAYYSNNNDDYKYETECYTHSQYFNKTQSSNEYWYHYFESDIGATLWNDEPYQRRYNNGNSLKKYNDGNTITRGTLRFVWTRYWTNQEHGSSLTRDINESYERNVYYTTTHYNDFQQYLNYYGGWAERIGNTEIGNDWGEYIPESHVHSMPEVNLVTLADLRAKL